MIPLSFAQQRLWLLDQVDGASPTYHISMAFRISGRLDERALNLALHDVVERHEVLRTVFPAVDGSPYQEIRDVADLALDMPVLEVAEADLDLAIAERSAEVFDLARDVPLRTWLFRIAPTEFVLLVVMHHIASDGWSLAPFSLDLSLGYAARCQGEEPDWSARPLPVQYADFALWQRELLASADPAGLLATQLGYWRRTLSGLPEETNLPLDRPRPAVASHRGSSVELSVSSDLHQKLTSVALTQGVTMHMLLQAALAVLLFRMGAGPDIAIGTPVAGRTDRELDNLVGFFVNTLVLRANLVDHPTFTELVAQVRATALDAYDNQDVPFEQLVEHLAPARSLSRNPLFQVALTLHNTSATSLRFPGAVVMPFPVTAQTARFDLEFSLSEMFEGGSPGGVRGALTYAVDLFDESTARGLAVRFVQLLEVLAEHPDQSVSATEVIFLAGERDRILVESNRSDRGVTAVSVVERFERQVKTDPDATALAAATTRVSYRALDERANRFARLLIEQGVGSESRVAVMLDRSVELVVALLGIIKAGAAYVPIDPAYPRGRIAFMVTDTAPSVVVTQTAYRDQVPANSRVLVIDDPSTEHRAAQLSVDPVHDSARGGPLSPVNAAYVVYTSGSTGQPKGVVVTHRGIDRLVHHNNYLQLRPDHTVAQLASVSFDAATFEIWGALVNGADWSPFVGHRL